MRPISCRRRRIARRQSVAAARRTARAQPGCRNPAVRTSRFLSPALRPEEWQQDTSGVRCSVSRVLCNAVVPWGDGGACPDWKRAVSLRCGSAVSGASGPTHSSHSHSNAPLSDPMPLSGPGQYQVCGSFQRGLMIHVEGAPEHVYDSNMKSLKLLIQAAST